jgi:predicted Zn-dependent protease
MPFEFGPPAVVEPPRERAAELLLAAGRPAEALAQADSAERMTPGRTQLALVRARALAALGRRPEARRAYAALDSVWRAAEPDFAPRAAARAEAGALAGARRAPAAGRRR